MSIQCSKKLDQAFRRLLPFSLALLLGTSGTATAASVNTTGLAVTDTTVTVGDLHSATGTMAISEIGSIQAPETEGEGTDNGTTHPQTMQAAEQPHDESDQIGRADGGVKIVHGGAF